MTWEYSGDPSSSARDEIRFLIGDTDSTFPLLQDAEIDYLIAKWAPSYGDPIWTAAVAAELVATKFAGVANISADGVSVNVGDLADKYRQLAASLRAMYKDGSIGGAVDISNLMWGGSWDASIKALIFGVGMNDNLYAGQQDFGGLAGYFLGTEYYGAVGESGP